MNYEINENTIFKFLDADNHPPYGKGKWYLPTGNKPGKWMPEIEGDLIPCAVGYHLLYAKDLLIWNNVNLYIAEYKGEMIDKDDKIVVRQARLLKKVDTWNVRTWVLFACDCAEQALSLIENADPRSIEAIRIARLYIAGEANKDDVNAAYAAAAAAYAAAAAAAYAAAADAAYAAAADAADAAARAAARAAAAYADAAYAAAYAADAAAYAAARAAAAYADAAYAAAYAADAAAYAAAREWQTKRLLMYLNGEL